MKTRSGGKDLLIVTALGVFAYWSLGFLQRDDLYLFGDNPGQFYSLRYPMKDGLEGLWRLTSWNPSWYAGFPELQFYPPGFVILGILIDAISFDRLSPFQTYEALRFFAYFLPALTTYALFRWLRTGTLTTFAAAVIYVLLQPLIAWRNEVVPKEIGEPWFLAEQFGAVVSLGAFILVVAGSAAAVFRKARLVSNRDRL